MWNFFLLWQIFRLVMCINAFNLMTNSSSYVFDCKDFGGRNEVILFLFIWLRREKKNVATTQLSYFLIFYKYEIFSLLIHFWLGMCINAFDIQVIMTTFLFCVWLEDLGWEWGISLFYVWLGWGKKYHFITILALSYFPISIH